MRVRGVSRRGLIAAAAETPAALLRVGSQKGGLRSLLEASGAARDLPYALQWAEFPAAAQAILVKQDSPLRGVADLRGRKVAGNRGGWGQYLIRSALKQAGVAPRDVGITLLPPSGASLAFRSGAVDAWAAWDPYVSLAVQRFGARVLVDGRGLTPAIALLAAHEDAIRSKRAALADFLGRFRSGWAWANGHIPDYARHNAALTGLPEPVLRRACATEQTRPVPLTPALAAELQAAADDALEFGLLRQALDVSRAFDASLNAANPA